MRSLKLCKSLSFVSGFFPISEPLLVSSVLRWQWYVWMRGYLLCWALSAPSLQLSHWWFLPFHFPHSFFLGTPKIQMMNLMECSYQFLIFFLLLSIVTTLCPGRVLNLIFPFFYWVFQYCKDFYYSHFTVILRVFLSNILFCFSVTMVSYLWSY